MDSQGLNEIEKGQLAATTIQCFTGIDGSLENFPGLMKRVIEERVWECRFHRGREHRLPNLRSLITEKPVAGWGEDPDKIEAIIKDDHEVLAMFREAMKGKPGRKPKQEKGCESQPKTKKGSGQKAYLDERLRRDHPGEFEKLKNGEHKSTRAAAIAAGIIKVKTPLEQIRALLPKLSKEELAELVAELNATH